MRSLLSKEAPPPAEDSVGVVTWALGAGGSIGAGLAFLTLHFLEEPWRSNLIPIIPPISSGLSLAARVAATEVQRRLARRRWERDQMEMLVLAEFGIPAQQVNLQTTQNAKAKEIAQASIDRYERIKSYALSALPGERPWLAELRLLIEENKKHTE